MKQVELYPPFHNAENSTIGEVKKGIGHKIITTRSPKKLWDKCLEFECYIIYNTAHGIYMICVEVPKILMSGETCDISQFFELGWYEWIYFIDNSFQLTDEKLVLGRCLGQVLILSQPFTC